MNDQTPSTELVLIEPATLPAVFSNIALLDQLLQRLETEARHTPQDLTTPKGRKAAGFPVQDYLFGQLPEPVDWTITNPPFRLARQFIERALMTSNQGVAMIVRSSFLEGVGRWNGLFSHHPPSLVMQFTERVVMHKGKLSAKGSTATAYCWLVWERDAKGTEFEWIRPCRKRLERPEDYA